MDPMQKSHLTLHTLRDLPRKFPSPTNTPPSQHGFIYAIWFPHM
jgi:hypothetical protein